MKHLNKMLAAAALTLPFMASAAVGDYTVTPAPGVVEELTSFEVAFAYAGLDEVEVDSYAVSVRKDGKLFSEVKKKGYPYTYTFTLDTPATEPGEYEVVFDAGSVTYWGVDYETSSVNEEPITFTYVIEGGADVAQDYTLIPEPGVVEDLTQFQIKFSRDLYESVELESTSVSVMKDGKLFSDVKKKGYDFDFTLTLNTPATEAGEYEVVIEAGGVTYYDADYNETYNAAPIKFVYTIEGAGTGEVLYDIAFTGSKPAAGTVDLDMIQFEGVTLYTMGATGLVVNPDGATISLTSDNGYSSTGKLKGTLPNNYFAPVSMVTKNGTYTLTVPAGSIVDEEYVTTKGKSGHANAETTFTFTCINGAPAGEPVVYDLGIKSVNPKEGTRDLTSDAFSSISITLPDGCAFAEDKFTLTMTAPQEQGDIELNFTSNWNGYLAFFDEPTYNGEYIVVIPEGSFGDAAWIANHEFGHANEEIALKWTLIGGMPTSVEVINAENLNNAPVYDLNGVRVADSLREAGNGLFVVNGQKVIVKK